MFWKFIKCIICFVLVIYIAVHFFGISFSLSRLEQSVKSVRALIPGTVPSEESSTSAEETPIAEPKDSVLPVQKNEGTVSAPAPLRVAGQGNGVLSVSGVISLTNHERANIGVASLQENSQLDVAAEAKLQDLFAKQYFEHVSPSGVGPADLARQAGYDYILIGQNLALGNFKNDATLVAAWMSSPGHRANILQSKFTQIGVAVGQGKYEGQTVWIAVQSFGLPATACPAVSASLNSKISLEGNQISAAEAVLASKKATLENTSPNNPAYNQEANEYNALVKSYNNLVQVTRSDVVTYNAMVSAYNACRDKNSI